MNQLVRIACPLCRCDAGFLSVNAPFGDRHLDKYGDLYRGHCSSEWKVCGRCGFVHQNPRPTIEALNEFYLTAQYHRDVPEPEQRQQEYVDFARSYYTEKIRYALDTSQLDSGSVFEIGFGHGGALKVFQEMGWRVAGVEPDGNLFAYARQLLGEAELKNSLFGESTNVDSPADLVFSNHTLEHVADLPDLMQGLTRVLKPGGFVFTCVPTYYKNRSDMSLRWMNAGHYSLFTHRSLSQLCVRYGLEPVGHTYRGWRREIDDLWHVARFTGNRRDPAAFYENPKRVQFYLNFVNPARSALFSPVFADYPRRLETLKTIGRGFKLLFTSPDRLLSRLTRKFTAR